MVSAYCGLRNTELLAVIFLCGKDGLVSKGESCHAYLEAIVMSSYKHIVIGKTIKGLRFIRFYYKRFKGFENYSSGRNEVKPYKTLYFINVTALF